MIAVYAIKETRNIKDDAVRRERACELAMKMAEALGVDMSDSDEDE